MLWKISQNSLEKTCDRVSINLIRLQACSLQHFVKSQANAEQHPESELFWFENYSYSSSILSSKNNRTYSKKNKQKNKVCRYSWDYTTNHNGNEDENEKPLRSLRYDISRPRSRHGYKYSTYKKCLTMMMLVCIKL